MMLELITAASVAFSPADPDRTLEERLVEEGHDEAVVEELFADETPEQTVIDLLSDNPEEDGRGGEITQEDYNQHIGIPILKDKLPDFMEEYEESLQEAKDEYGVDPRYIAAIIGVETRFGENTGDFDVTRVYDTIYEHVPSRREFGLKQAECLVELAEEYGAEAVDEWEGSYAGAMGFGQFIPCSFRDYFVGDIDEMDATIESVANYLRNNKLTYPPTGEQADWDPVHNGEPLTEETNYPALWAYNRSGFYINAVDELATSLPYTQLAEADDEDDNTSG